MKLSLRLEDDLYASLLDRAYGADLSLSEFIRRLLKQAAVPGARYLFTANDELLGIAIQTFTLVAALVAEQSPAAVQKGMDEARQMLDQRGLLNREHAR